MDAQIQDRGYFPERYAQDRFGFERRNTVVKYIVASLALVALVVFFTGCSEESGYVNADEPDSLGGTGIDSQDVRTVAQEMSRDLLSAPAIANAQGKPIIALLPTKNETRFRVDTDIITQQMRDNLIQFAGDKATFVDRERMAAIKAERAAKRAGEVSSSGEKMVSGADFFLTGTLKSISKSAGGAVSDYIYYSFELIDTESSNVVWAKGYDVKKVGKHGVLYR
jgi:PBP1b-binding outer membrane lipoprotein LpoB